MHVLNKRMRLFATVGVALSLAGAAISSVTPALAAAPVSDAQAGTIAAWGPGSDWANHAIPEVPASQANTVFKQVEATGPTSAVGLTAAGKLVVLGTPAYQMALPAELANQVVVDVAASGGIEAGLALTATGGIVGWGPLGPPPMPAPADASGLVDLEVAPDQLWGAGIKADGSVIAWGSNSYGQMEGLAGLSQVKQLSLSSSSGYALKANGTLAYWGKDNPVPDPDPSAEQPQPIPLPASVTNEEDDLDVVSVVALTYGGMALMSDGTVVQWEMPTQTGPNPADVPPPFEDKVVAIGSDGSSNVAIDKSGKSYVWGLVSDPAMGRLPAGLDASRISSIDAGYGFVTAIVKTTVRETSKPTASGTALEGQRLTGTPATFSGDPESVSSQWYAGSAPITGATGASYTLTRAEVGKQITYRTTAVKGTERMVSSSVPTAAVRAKTVTPPAPVAKSASAVSIKRVYKKKTKVLTVTAKVTAVPRVPTTGKVSFVLKRGKKTVKKATVTVRANGTAVLKVKKMKKGKHTLVAKYSGSNRVKASAKTVKFKIG